MKFSRFGMALKQCWKLQCFCLFVFWGLFYFFFIVERSIKHRPLIRLRHESRPLNRNRFRFLFFSSSAGITNLFIVYFDKHAAGKAGHLIHFRCARSYLHIADVRKGKKKEKKDVSLEMNANRMSCTRGDRVPKLLQMTRR